MGWSLVGRHSLMDEGLCECLETNVERMVIDRRLILIRQLHHESYNPSYYLPLHYYSYIQGIIANNDVSGIITLSSPCLLSSPQPVMSPTQIPLPNEDTSYFSQHPIPSPSIPSQFQHLAQTLYPQFSKPASPPQLPSPISVNPFYHWEMTFPRRVAQGHMRDPMLVNELLTNSRRGILRYGRVFC
jgi:hypothetical protein